MQNIFCYLEFSIFRLGGKQEKMFLNVPEAPSWAHVNLTFCSYLNFIHVSSTSAFITHCFSKASGFLGRLSEDHIMWTDGINSVMAPDSVSNLQICSPSPSSSSRSGSEPLNLWWSRSAGYWPRWRSCQWWTASAFPGETPQTHWEDATPSPPSLAIPVCLPNMALNLLCSEPTVVHLSISPNPRVNAG